MRFKQRQGVVFVVTLAALASIVASVAVFSQNQREAVQVTINRNELRRAKHAAEAAIQQAMTDLQTVAENTQDPVTLEDDWATRGNAGADSFILGRQSFRMQVVDNSSRLDLNTINEEQLLNLNLFQEQVDSFLDWREAGNNARASGAKDEYYNGLPNRYNAHLNRLQSVTELLNIQNFTPSNIYELPQNTSTTGTNVNTIESPLIELVSIDCFSAAYDPQGNGKVNVNQPQIQAQQLAQQAQISVQSATAIIAARAVRPNQQFTAVSQIITLPNVSNNQQDLRNILDRVSVSQTERVEGRVNINTASAEVIGSIPGITRTLADQIVDQRPSGGYRALSEMVTVSSDSSFIGAVADNFATNSQSFIVRAIGKAGRMTYAIEALVVIENSAPKILRIEQAPFSNMTERWQWQDAASEVTLLENQ
jgi:type II secretory pathway component PulK